jgi:CHAT domain-containing protein
LVNCSHQNISIPIVKDKLEVKKKRLAQLKEPRALAHAHLSLANMYLENQMIQLAIKHYTEAQKYGKLSFNSTLFEAQTLLGMGEAYRLLKKPSNALIYHEKAYENIKDSLYFKDEKTTILYALAKDYIELNQEQKAIETLTLALEITLYDKKEIHPKTVKINNLLSILTRGKGAFKISLKNYKRLYGNNSMEVADLYFDLGFQKNSLEYYENALKIYKKKLPFSHPKIYKIHYKMALIHKKLKNKNDYFSHMLDTFDSFYQNQEFIFSTLSSSEKSTYIKKLDKILVELFDSYLPTQPEELFNRWLNYKRKLYDEENALARLSLKKDERNTVNKLKKYKQKLAQAYQNLHIDKGVTAHLKKKIIELERSSSLNFFYHKQNRKSIDYKEVSRQIKPKELYIDFAKIKDNYYFFTLNHKEEITVKKLSSKESQRIDELVGYFQLDINSASNSDNKKSGLQRLFGIFYTTIFKKIALKGINSLIVSADSSLNLIPFEALYDEEKKRYLIETLTIRYIPSGRELINQRNSNKMANKDTILFSKSDFTAYKNFDNLKYTTIEMENIKSIYPSSKIFQGKEATKANLLKVNSPKILHLSTHGEYQKKSKSSNPLLNTFIYLNKPISGLELSGVNLKGTELVVLSACETGIGEIKNAEGVSSMAKALMEAGAKNTLVSLWLINDQATTKLMKLFYQNIKKGLPYKNALRQAKLTLLKNPKFEEPSLWSAMILMGRE